MVRADKKRISVTLTIEAIERLDFYAGKMGLNRSSLCAYLVGQGLLGLDKAYGLFDDLPESLLASLASGGSGGVFDGASDDGLASGG